LRPQADRKVRENREEMTEKRKPRIRRTFLGPFSFDSGLRTLDSRLQTLDSRLSPLDLELETWNLKLIR